jgi:hypothetical protein
MDEEEHLHSCSHPGQGYVRMRCMHGEQCREDEVGHFQKYWHFMHSVLFPANERNVRMCVLPHDIDFESNHKRMLEGLKYV